MGKGCYNPSTTGEDVWNRGIAMDKVDIRRFRKAFGLVIGDESSNPLAVSMARKEVASQMPLILKELHRCRKLEKLRESERANMVHGAIDVGPYKIPIMIPLEEELAQGEILMYGRLTILDITDDQCNIILNDVEYIGDIIEKSKEMEDKVVGLRIKEYRKGSTANEL